MLLPTIAVADDGASADNPLRQTQAVTTDPIPPRTITPSGALQWRASRFAGHDIERDVAPVAAYSDVTERPAATELTQNNGPPLGGGSILTPSPGRNTAPERTPPPVLDVPKAPVEPSAPQKLPGTPPEAVRMDDKDAYDCQAGWDEMSHKKLSDISLDITMHANGELEVPEDCKLDHEMFEPRQWETTNFVWTASGMCHKPPYFEDVQLERYGHETGPLTQPLVSGAHFFGSVLLLPYSIGLELPGECVYDLGYYRPGNCAPYMIPAFPITARATLFELGAATGLVYLLP